MGECFNERLGWGSTKDSILDMLTLRCQTSMWRKNIGNCREFSGCPVVQTRCFHCWGLGSVPSGGTKVLQATRPPPPPPQKKKEKKRKRKRKRNWVYVCLEFRREAWVGNIKLEVINVQLVLKVWTWWDLQASEYRKSSKNLALYTPTLRVWGEEMS